MNTPGYCPARIRRAHMPATRRVSATRLLRAVLRVALLLASAQVSAQGTVARLLPAASEIVFVSRQMGAPVEGRFERFDARVELDTGNPAHPAVGRVELTVATASATLGVAEIDAELRKPAWLDVARHPQAHFVSRAIVAAGPGRWDVAGVLTIKGATRELRVPVTLEHTGATAVARGGFAIRRTEFGIGSGEWADTSLVADEVQLRFKIALEGLPR